MQGDKLVLWVTNVMINHFPAIVSTSGISYLVCLFIYSWSGEGILSIEGIEIIAEPMMTVTENEMGKVFEGLGMHQTQQM